MTLPARLSAVHCLPPGTCLSAGRLTWCCHIPLPVVILGTRRGRYSPNGSQDDKEIAPPPAGRDFPSLSWARAADDMTSAAAGRSRATMISIRICNPRGRRRALYRGEAVGRSTQPRYIRSLSATAPQTSRSGESRVSNNRDCNHLRSDRLGSVSYREQDDWRVSQVPGRPVVEHHRRALPGSSLPT